MAEVRALMINLEKEDHLTPMVTSGPLAQIAAGFSFTGGTIWTRDGYDDALMDCLRLQEAVTGMLRKLVEQKAEVEKKEAEEDGHSRMDLGHDQDEEAAAEGEGPV